MKMPDSVNLGVQNLSTVDPGKPMQVATAEAKETGAFADAVNTFGEIGTTIYKRNATGERNASQATFKMKESKLRADLEANPYEQMPDGSLRSRHNDIVKEYDEQSADLRDQTLDAVENPLAKHQLGQDFETFNAVARNAVQATAMTWANNDARKKNEVAFEANLRNFQYESARSVTNDELATGLINEKQWRDKQNKVETHERYFSISEGIKNNTDMTGKQANYVLSQIKKEEKENYLDEKATNNLYTQLQKNTEQRFNSALDDMIWKEAGVSEDERYTGGVGWDKGGFVAGALLRRTVLRLSPEDLGVRDEKSKEALVSSITNRLNMYKLKLEENDAARLKSVACARAVSGVQLTQKNIPGVSDLAKEQGLGTDRDAANCAFSEMTYGQEPWSEEWFENGIQREVNDWGFLSTEAKSHLNQLFVNPGSSPEAANRFLFGVQQIDKMLQLPGGRQALNYMSKEDMALYHKVAALQSATVATAGDARTTVTGTKPVLTAEGLQMMSTAVRDIPDNIKSARLSNYQTNTAPKLKDMATEAMDDSFFTNVIVTDDLVADLDVVMQELVPIYGDDALAFKQAFSQVAPRYSTETYSTSGTSLMLPDDLKTMKDGPMYTYRNQASPAKLEKALATDYSEFFAKNGLAQDEFDIMPASIDQKTKKPVFYVKRRDSGQPYMTENGEMYAWSFNYEDSTEAKVEAKQLEATRLEAEAVTAVEQAEVLQDIRNPVRVQKRNVGRKVLDAVIDSEAAKFKVVAALPGLIAKQLKIGDDKIEAAMAEHKKNNRDVEKRVNEWNDQQKVKALRKQDPVMYNLRLKTLRANLERYVREQDMRDLKKKGRSK